MKLSLYNSIIQISDNRWLVYNALSDSYLALRQDCFPELNILASKGDLYSDILISSGMIVREDKDEIEDVRSLIEKLDGSKEIFHLHVNPTLACNFNCWYCYEDHSNKDSMSDVVLEAVKNLINLKIKGRGLKMMKLSFFGGEPLLYFDRVARQLISHADYVCRKNCIPLQLHFTSNGYLLSDRILSFLLPYNLSFQITLDGHRQSHNKVRKAPDGSYDIILKNVKRLLDIKKSVILRINFTSSTINELDDIIKDIEPLLSQENKKYLIIDLQQVWQDISILNHHQIRNITLQKLEQLQSIGLKASSPVHNDSIRNACYADKFNHLLVNYNGLVYFCTARDFKIENALGEILKTGEIKWRNHLKNQWESIKFNRPQCLRCRIAPICGGGCRQKSIEWKDMDGCIYNYSEQDKDNIVLRRFEQYVISNSEE